MREMGSSWGSFSCFEICLLLPLLLFYWAVGFSSVAFLKLFLCNQSSHFSWIPFLQIHLLLERYLESPNQYSQSLCHPKTCTEHKRQSQWGEYATPCLLVSALILPASVLLLSIEWHTFFICVFIGGFAILKPISQSRAEVLFNVSRSKKTCHVPDEKLPEQISVVRAWVTALLAMTVLIRVSLNISTHGAMLCIDWLNKTLGSRGLTRN